jgi:hypothetical protein
MSNLVPIFGTIMVFGWLIVTVIVNYRMRRDMFALYHQERLAAIEKGVELPPIPEDFFKEDGAKPRSLHSDFGWALFWLLGGLAVLVALYFNFSGKVALFALIPIAIGLHYLIYYSVIGKKEAAALEAERRAKTAEAGQISKR